MKYYLKEYNITNIGFIRMEDSNTEDTEYTNTEDSNTEDVDIEYAKIENIIVEDTLLTQLTRILPLLEEEDSQAAIKLKEAISTYKENLSMDKNLLLHLKDIADMHDEPLITSDKYADLLKKINNNSIIVYFKSANIFRVYDASQISTDLTNHLNGNFRKNKHMYEVVPNDLPQKIIIMCEKGIISHIDTIKNYVIEYLKTKNIVDINDSDIKLFENESGIIELIINGFYVSNSKERDSIVGGLMRFIDLKEKNSAMTNKMKCQEFTPFDDSQIVSMPNCKTQIGGQSFNFVDMLIRNLDECKSITNGNVYINIVQANSIANVNTGTINKFKHVNNTTQSDKIGDFVKYIKLNKPKWYKPGTLINKNVVYDKYIEQFGEITKVAFTKAFKNKIFSNDIRKPYKK